MIKNLLSIALISTSLMVNAQSFTATYDFVATTSVTGTTDPSIPPSVAGLTCGSFMAVGTPSANANASGRFSFVGWPMGSTTTVDTYSTMTGSINTSEYYEVILTPQSGATLALNSIAFTAQRSGTGIRSYVVRTSADGFTNNLPASVATNTNLSVVGTNEFFWNLDAVTSAQNGSTITLFGATTTSSVSFRFYAWNSEAVTGTFSIDNVVFDGSMSGVVTGLTKVSSDSNLNIYPVPTNDGILFIENKNAQDISKIEVLDILGNVVLTSSSKSETKIKLNLTDMPNGNYFVRVHSGNSVSTKKIVVLK